MSANTSVEGYPYPQETDFADVQDAFRLATAIDADMRAEQAPFRSFLGRPSFIARQLNNQTGFTAGSQTMNLTVIEWDNTGGVGGSVWSQPYVQQPSWWLFGCTIFALTISGTPVVGDLMMGQIQITTTDQVTAVQSTSNWYQRNDDTNTGGEFINLFAMAPIYRGSAACLLNLNGTAQKAIGAASRFWGMYLGPVV